MVYILRFVCDLQAGAAHAKMHRVHVDTTWIRLALGRLGQVSILITVYRYLDLHLLLAALVDRLRQAEEAWVRTTRFFGDEHLMSVLISDLDAALLRPLDISPDLVILRRHRIRCTQDWASGGRYELDIVLGPQESVQIVASTVK